MPPHPLYSMQLLLLKVVKTLEAHHQTCNSSVTDTRGTGIALIIYFHKNRWQTALYSRFHLSLFYVVSLRSRQTHLLHLKRFTCIFLVSHRVSFLKKQYLFFSYKQTTMPLAFTWDVIVGLFFPKHDFNKHQQPVVIFNHAFFSSFFPCRDEKCYCSHSPDVI